MTRFEGSRTERNLLVAFAGESQARNRYEFYAKSAKKEGFIGISKLFEEVASQERSHAKSFFKLLTSSNTTEITASYPAGRIGTTAQNLDAAIQAEGEETDNLYPEFAREAEEEGFSEIAVLFRSIAVAEGHHKSLFEEQLTALEDGKIFERETPVKWVCEKCGYIHEGKTPPPKCPACAHPADYFVVDG